MPILKEGKGGVWLLDQEESSPCPESHELRQGHVANPVGIVRLSRGGGKGARVENGFWGQSIGSLKGSK